MGKLKTGNISGETLIPGVKIIKCRESRVIDKRGTTCEIWRSDFYPLHSMHVPAMCYYSMTLPHVKRGPHEHRHQTDYFAFFGPGEFELYLWDAREKFPLATAEIHDIGQTNPCIVIIPPGVVHGYRNRSSIPGITINMPDRLYKGHNKEEEVDEIRHENDPDSIYKIP